MEFYTSEINFRFYLHDSSKLKEWSINTPSSRLVLTFTDPNQNKLIIQAAAEGEPAFTNEFFFFNYNHTDFNY